MQATLLCQKGVAWQRRTGLTIGQTLANPTQLSVKFPLRLLAAAEVNCMADRSNDGRNTALHEAFEALIKSYLRGGSGAWYLSFLTVDLAVEILLIGCETGYCQSVVRHSLEGLEIQDPKKASGIQKKLRQRFIPKGWCSARCCTKKDCPAKER
jgi:hypothetical protein